MKALYLKAHVTDPTQIKLEWIEQPIPSIGANECLIKIASSGINPSDALAATGYFKDALLPRIPGRDFSGIVTEGPANLIGKKVWGTGGDAGIEDNGTQAEYIKLAVMDIAEIPSNLDIVAAGAQTLPYVTAYYGLVKRAQIAETETVLVTGALGQVGRAAMSICYWKNCQPIALVRGEEQVNAAKELGWRVLNSDDANLEEKMAAINAGKPINVIFNSLGNIYWQDFMKSLAAFGRIVTISARPNARDVTINLFELYRANQTLIGINTVPLSLAQNAQLLNELKMGFEANKLQPLPLDQSAIYTPERASEAYQTVLRGTDKRVVIDFS